MAPTANGQAVAQCLRTYKQQDSVCIQMSDKESIQTKTGIQWTVTMRMKYMLSGRGRVRAANTDVVTLYNQVKLVPSDTPVKSRPGGSR